MEAQEARYPDNGILRLYNQFPGMYANLTEMTADIPRIVAMGFNAIWVNPFHPTGKFEVKRREGREDFRARGSLYSITDFKHINPQLGEDVALRYYIDQVRANGLIPVFDLVLRHVANDIDLKSQNLKIEWFKPYRDGKEMDDTLDFVYAIPSGKKGAIRQEYEEIFGANAEKLWPEIFEQFWKPYIDQMIRGYGFSGVRIDAVKHLPPYVIKDVCEYLHAICPNVVIFGELLFLHSEPKKVIERYTNLGITHITNALYSQNFDFSSRKFGTWKSGKKQGEGDLIQEMLSWLNAATRKPGGTIGFVGSHDETSLASSIRGAENLEKAMKERIAAVAFTSNGGWYLMCGDEFGYERREIKIVFGEINREGGGWFANKKTSAEWSEAAAKFNFSRFIHEINTKLSALPPLTADDWVEHLVLDQYPDLMIIVRNSGKGFEGDTRVVLVNTGNTHLELPADYKEMIALAMRALETQKKGNRDNQAYCEMVYNKLRDLDDRSVLTIGNLSLAHRHVSRPH
ncbi:MAG: alpha-amylase family glycosyl hydrolase [Gammaproteobacteria bacterium]|nr:alpha-amylase family glycosyl hydrolase [Gammaproteobacteria bacterium]